MNWFSEFLTLIFLIILSISFFFCLFYCQLKKMHIIKVAAAAAAKSLQSCPTLCDSIDGSPPGSAVPGILQARTLEWAAISFSNAWQWKWSRSVVSDSSRPHGLQPSGVLCPWDFPGKSTGVGCHRLLCYKYILYTKYVTEPPMKIVMTRQLAAVDQYIVLYMINDCNGVTLVMGRCNKRECFPGP